MTTGERIRELRKSLNLTLDKFGEKIGVGKTAISKIERGENNLSDQMLISICREYNVNKEWLRDGVGEMRSSISVDAEYEKICADLKITDPKAKQLIINYGRFSPEDKELLWNYVERLFNIEHTPIEQLSNEDAQIKSELISSGSEKTVEEAEAEYIKNCSNSAHKQGSTASNTTAGTDYAKKASNE